MKKGTRKLQITVITVIAAVLALTLIGGSLAYFTDTDETTNTFTVGGVEINQVEQEADGTDYVNDPTVKVYLPLGDDTDPASDDNFIDKVVFVENTGKSSAYIRTFVAVPAAVDAIVKIQLSDSTKWTAETSSTATIDGVDYVVYPFTYTDAVAAGAQTEVLMTGTYMISAVDIKVNPANNEKQFCTPGTSGYDFYDYDVDGEIKVVIASQAVQSQGFADAATAIGAAFAGNPWA